MRDGVVVAAAVVAVHTTTTCESPSMVWKRPWTDAFAAWVGPVGDMRKAKMVSEASNSEAWSRKLLLLRYAFCLTKIQGNDAGVNVESSPLRVHRVICIDITNAIHINVDA